VAAELLFHEHPGTLYPAKVSRTSQALDPNLRTLQVELLVDNSKGELFPGAYAEVHFKLPGNGSTLRVPATALVFRSAGLQVATVQPGDHVKLQSVAQGRDFGTSVEVLRGLAADDVIIVNPPDSIADGEQVRVGKPRG
jgi:multidrug efflux pump subunit AcrA (membrane-fusion protein)